MLLTIATVHEGCLRPSLERATITRLGAGVDASRRLCPAATARTLACLTDYAAAIRDAAVTRLAVVGTSALRDAAGSEDFCAAAAAILGEAPRVISGDEEAHLTFLGALSGLDVIGNVLVFDVGGGSTELITGALVDGVPHIETARSLDVGSVRLRERHLRHDPPTAAELAAARSEVRELLQRRAAPDRSHRLVGVAGTVTTLAAVAAKLVPYVGHRVHGASLTATTLHQQVDELAALPLAARAELPGLEPARADVIVTGAIVVSEILRWAGGEAFTVSDRGVRWGLLTELRAQYGKV